MKGSEKQIRWANEIVAGEKSTIEKHISGQRQRVALDGEKYPNLKLMLAAQEACCAYVLSVIDRVDDARLVIDNRGGLRYHLLKSGIKTMPNTEVVAEFAKQNPEIGRNIFSVLVG